MSKNPTDRLAWVTQLRSLHRLYRHKEAEFWEHLVARNGKNPRRLWTSISGLLGHVSRSPASPAFSADDFLKMMTEKIASLRASTADAPLPQFCTTDTKLDGFRSILEAELRRSITSSNQKSCELDPLPTFIIANILDDIIPFYCTFSIGPFLRATSQHLKNGLWYSLPLRGLTLTRMSV